MTQRTATWSTWSALTALAVLAAACGGGNGESQPTPTPTTTRTPTSTATSVPATAAATPTLAVTPTRSVTATLALTATPTNTPVSAGVTGLLVVDRSIAAESGDGLGAPPPQWAGAPDMTAFDRSLAYADWSVAGVEGVHGVSGPDGSFQIDGLAPGRYTLLVTKTVDGNILSSPNQSALAIPFTVGDQGSTQVVAQVSWGLVRSVSTYQEGTSQVQEIRGPYGTSLVIRDGRVTALGDSSRTFVDADSDGRFEVAPCIDRVWECGADRTCGDDRFCACTASCPFCDDCGPGVCVPPLTVSPYRCNDDGTCQQPADRCVCVASCPDCDDCARSVCVPGCEPVEILAITISGGPSQLVVGQSSMVQAAAQLSDGSRIDVTHLATWQSSDDAVVTVDSWGTIAAVSVGSANLTATLGDVTSLPRAITVTARPTLQRIEVQNVSCYYPVGLPTDFGSTPPAAPTGDLLPPVPRCRQIVQIGATIQFRAVGEFANGFYQDITNDVQWEVSPSAVGDAVNGLFTAREAGTAALTASLEGVVSDPTTIRVVTEPTVVALSIYADNGIIVYADGVPPRVGDTVPAQDGIAVPCIGVPDGVGQCCCPVPEAADPLPCDCGYSITILRDDQLSFRATAEYDTGEFRDVTELVTWRSNNPEVATIEMDGVMTAVAAGDATIDAVMDDVTSNPVGVHVVDEATLLSLYINQEGTERVVGKGDQRFFTATGAYDVGFSREVTDEATWRSSDEQVGGFDAPGVFTARAAGTVQVWAELDGQESNRISLEVFETSELDYCDPANVNRAVWSDNFDRVTLESDCAQYSQPGVVALRYTVTEHQPHGGIFDPCLDLYVYQGNQRVRTLREEGCGDPFLATAAPGRDEAVLKYQLRAFWDLKDERGEPVAPGTYTIYGRFYLYYDPVVSLDVTVLTPDGFIPTPTPTPGTSPVCTPPPCPPGGTYSCPTMQCTGGCGVVCVPPAALASIDGGSAIGVPGDRVQLSVSLRTGGQLIAGAQNDLLFDPNLAVAEGADGQPDCTVNPDIDKGATAFAYIPADCSNQAHDCRGVRALVVATHNTAPIADGSLLYSCTFAIPANLSPGTYPIIVSGAVVSDPLGNALPVTSTNGSLAVVLQPGDTPIPLPTPTPTPASACLPPPCGANEVFHCADSDGCPLGCGYVCATPTPAGFCTPIVCLDGQVPSCRDDCPDGCPNACATPKPTPTPEGVCIRGPSCEGGGVYELRSSCCYFSQISASSLPFTWCPLDAWDPETSTCAACAGDPCEGLPPTPTIPRS